MSDEERASALRAGLSDSDDWSNRAVVVTGASGGTGKEIVGALLEVGAKVVLSDIDSDELAAAAKGLQVSSEHLAIFLADIGEESHVHALNEHALERFGKLYGWVNNAGTVDLSPALQTTRASFVGQLTTNVVALFQCCQAAARAIGTGGAIVNVASNAGKVGLPDMVGYNASKAAVINLTRNLAEEWATCGINVNAVCPGSVSTPMLRRVAEYLAGKNNLDTDEVLARFISHQVGRAIEPLEVGRGRSRSVEVGRVIVFLLSNAAKKFRGQAINVDAGDTPY